MCSCDFVFQFNEIVCNQVVTLGLHYPDMKKGNVIPRKGDLRPHPLGDERWCHEAQQSLMLLQKDKVLMLWNFLPLLARYCSNADIAGEVVGSLCCRWSSRSYFITSCSRSSGVGRSHGKEWRTFSQ